MLSLWQRFIFEMTFAIKSDPWKYTSLYQQTKYQQTLDLLGSIPIARALELGCAEGYLTLQLAPRVDSLIAADISQIALDRAEVCCAAHKLENVSFLRLDLAKDQLPSDFDLIVCSEVLYYINGLTALEAVARKLVDALKPGGYLLTAHAHRVDEEPERTKFDQILPFGAKLISQTLATTEPLRLVNQIWTPFYGIQLFQRDCPTATSAYCSPELTQLDLLPQPEDGALNLFSLAFLYNQFRRWRQGSTKN